MPLVCLARSHNGAFAAGSRLLQVLHFPPRPADGTAPTAHSHRHRGSTSASASSSSSSSSRNIWNSSSGTGGAVTTSSSPNSHSITLEALRNNPFGSTSRSRSLQQQTFRPAEDLERELDELNTALEKLVRIFPDVRIEVFRELLTRFDGLSRLEVCVDQLVRHKEKWVEGRWNISEDQNKKDEQARITSDDTADGNLVPADEQFRSEDYKAAVRSLLAKEFSGLGRSMIDGVLAEANFSYWRARPILRNLSRRTWRATFNSLLPSFKRKKDRDEHPLLAWQRQPDGEILPRLKDTGCAELDNELHAALLAPLLDQRRENQETEDYQFALELNEREAIAACALYECECCFADVTFEQIATCSSNTHIICYHCIQRTVHEALFGQGWGKSMDLERSTLKCLAPLSVGACDGCLHPEIVRQAILLNTAGAETFRKLEDRLASEALMKSQLRLVRCPFCSYAEVDPVYHPSTRGIRWRVRRDGDLIPTILMAVLILDLVPLLVLPLLILLLFNPSAVGAIFKTSIRHLCLKIRLKRFTCANTSCRRVSCMTCQKDWRDPHVCHEPLLLDLRATVEAARTAAVKRTCPRCGLSFVKSSGCNKLTCVCGYSMCYLCRKALGPPVRPVPLRRGFDRPRPQNLDAYDGGADGPDEDEEGAGNVFDDEFEEPEGYKHFCEHFRINPGSRCSECNKCDLYQAEDEEAVARRAGEKAEREWLLRQGAMSTSSNPASAMALRNVNQDLSAGADTRTNARRAPNSLWDLHLPPNKRWSYWLSDVWADGRWKLEAQVLVNWIVERAIVIEEV
ncbi:hypothetical protein N7462_008581 [Penicillium macrosclerotiorum]|uniref:uncharacterized protein n=1 Tax=Penicillium macrosclerotiorum TaxID=303699 RepID=UPI002549AF76|nr:uncharacterized protein N7462_008581 [Penicillium macrosclerotiorum]KAJ5675684.1 hypothetical protein N7462_008581 [Penicillium macrosclerotiorum]